MSQNKPFQTLADKYKAGGEFNDRLNQRSVESNVRSNRGLRGSVSVGQLTALLFVFTILLLSVLKNPSESEAKESIKSMIIEKVYELSAQESSPVKMTWMQSLFLPTIVDELTRIKVNDYILFSTFNSSIQFEDKNMKLTSGIILFGKIIPLKSRESSRKIWPWD